MDPAALPNLDPQFADFVRALPEMSGAFDDIPAARQMMDLLVPSGPAPGEERLEITDVVVPGADGEPDVPVRVYRPREADTAAGTAPSALPGLPGLPGLLHIHGGGFCLGSVDGEHAAAAGLAADLGIVVVSVEYRLAPEHPYPAGLTDCYRALEYLAGLDGVDPARVGVHGQSAGGGLAAAVALLARDRGGPALCFQALGIPELDDRLDTPSMRAFTDTPLWSRAQAEPSWRYYLGGQEADQYAAPARATSLAGLPPAYISVCELDPLRDEGLTYGMRLLADGVSAEVHCYPGVFHGAVIVPGTDVGRRIQSELVDALRRGLHV